MLRITGTLHETQYTLLIIYRSVLRVKSDSNKAVEKIEKHFFYSIHVFFEYFTIYEILWKNMVEQGRPQTIWHIRCTYWIPKAKNTHLQFVMPITFHCNNGCTKAPLLFYT
jgi:hypothetical protein